MRTMRRRLNRMDMRSLNTSSCFFSGSGRPVGPTRRQEPAARRWRFSGGPSRSVPVFGAALGQVGEGFFDLVPQSQAQVAGLQARQGGVDGDELTANLFDVCGA